MNGEKRPILIVEDEAVLRESLRDWLTEEGYQVETAEAGETALRSIAEHDYGLLILDLRLPGKDGLQVLKEARAGKPDLKGIIMTAYPSVQTAVEAMKAGAVDYLPKPFDLNDLEALIRKCLEPVQVEIKPEAGTAVAEPVVKALEVPAIPEEEERARVEEVIDEATGKVYLPPCQIACPISQDIQRNNVMLACLPLDTQQAAAQIIKIGDELYEKNPLFPICGYVCGLCERKCNYKEETGAVRRRMLERFIADYYLPYLNTKPALPLPTRERVAVVGGGPAGLMCAYALSKKGYRVTIIERGTNLGGALRYIPQYRLPANIMDTTMNNLTRIAHIDVRYGVKIGEGKKLDDLKREGYQAIFIATGTHSPRPLTFEGHPVAGTDLEGVDFGLYLLSDMNYGRLSRRFFPQLLRSKRVIVIGGGNVAFDVARSARRLAADVSIVCLECADKSSKDGIPADVEEIEGAIQEDIKIYYSRGIAEIIGEQGGFKKIKCAKCVSVFDETGFNPKFDGSDVIDIEGDVLLVTIGQAPDRALFQQEDLLDAKGRLDVDKFTLMSNRKQGVLVGGDVRRQGFAAEAMRDGIAAAESIDRYLRGKDLKEGREKQYEEAPLPGVKEYKAQPELEWMPAEERLNFELFEKGLTMEEALAEAKRCLHCGPCRSCKACVAMGFQPEIPEVVINQDICSGCGVCVAVCNYDATKLAKYDGRKISVIDPLKCKRCGVCVVACPVEARADGDKLMSELASALAS